MNKTILLALIMIIISSSCYMYDGPTRPKVDKAPPKPIEIPVKKSLSAQQYLEKMAGDIERKLPTAQVKILQDSIKVLFPDNIKYDKSAILPLENINNEISKLAQLIQVYDKTAVLVTGHTDNTGDEQNNKRISELRATYILDLLRAYKAPKDRTSAWGLGSSNPLSDDSGDNRRVEFIVLATMDDNDDS